MSSIKLSGGGHWYAQNGTAQHDADLRVARKQNLLRSVTSIDKDQFKNEALERYKMEKLAEAAFESPRQPHEDVDQFSQRIYELSLEHSMEAADKGKDIHDAIDNIGSSPKPELVPFIDPVKRWFDENVVSIISSEKTVVDLEIGVAGRMDKRIIHRVHGSCVIDYKSQGIKTVKGKKNKPAFYPAFSRQLGFYAACEAKSEGVYPRMDTCISLVIDSLEPNPPHEKVYTVEETQDAYEDFVIAAWSYYKKKNYWPVGQWDLCDALKRIRS